MKLIEAMKKLKNLNVKATELRQRVALSHISSELPQLPARVAFSILLPSPSRA